MDQLSGVRMPNDMPNDGAKLAPENSPREISDKLTQAHSNPRKLFVGQVPKSVDESELCPIFQQFGEVEDLAIIRDKHSGYHRGCAFVTFSTKECAEAAIFALHEKYQFAQSTNAMQVKVADTKPRREMQDDAKLFVGMLPKSMTETDLKALFQPFGYIKEVHMILDPEGNSRGCAFLRLANRESAMMAIAALDQQVVLNGFRPMTVNFARKSASQKKQRSPHIQQAFASMQQVQWMYVPVNQGGMVYSSQVAGSDSTVETCSPTLSESPPTDTSTTEKGRRPPPIEVSTQQQSMMHPFGMMHLPLSPTSPTSPYMNMVPFNQLPVDYSGQEPISPVYAAPYFPSFYQPISPTNHTRQMEGPPGANLFIYHLPHEINDADLVNLFTLDLGQILSAKVYIDKRSGESKGFGFVSYDSAEAAEVAIQRMNGYSIGGKRLKVQHKRVQDQGKGRGSEDATTMMGNLTL